MIAGGWEYVYAAYGITTFVLVLHLVRVHWDLKRASHSCSKTSCPPGCP